MDRRRILDLDPFSVPSPAYVVDAADVEANLGILAEVRRRAGCRVLLAMKGFSLWRLFPLMRDYLDGTCASGPWEARLGREEFGKEVHVYAPAYSEADMAEILPLADHIVFNSFSQLSRFGAAVADYRRRSGRPVQVGLRVNPESRQAEVELYDPSAPGSRLGTTAVEFAAAADPAVLEGLDGLHFHNLCEQGLDALENTLGAVEAKFGRYFESIRWINFGGGHHITRPGYEVDGLVELVLDFRRRTGLEVILEPGEAAVIRSGALVASVLDVISNSVEIAVLDVSATAHLPDVLEMPYRPEVRAAAKPGEKPHTYRLGGLSCLAGDVIGDYSFDRPLEVGDRVVFEDMAHYTMVKTTFFNGVRHPAIAVRWGDGQVEVVREFCYDDFKRRLA